MSLLIEVSCIYVETKISWYESDLYFTYQQNKTCCDIANLTIAPYFHLHIQQKTNQKRTGMISYVDI